MQQEILLQVLSFLGERRKQEGGYGATPLLPATVEDTYHALRIHEAMRENPRLGEIIASLNDQRSLKSYLAPLMRGPWISARTAFQLMYCASSARILVGRGKAKGFLNRRLAGPIPLSERYYCARILREMLHIQDAANRPKARMAGFSKWRTASELWMKLYLRRDLPSRECSQIDQMVTWLQACQNYDGGFGFLPGATSFIENSHTCVKALTYLNAKPLDLDACLHFVLACRTGRGGFARNPGAAPFLDATWHAVAVLSLLGASS